MPFSTQAHPNRMCKEKEREREREGERERMKAQSCRMLSSINGLLCWSKYIRACENDDQKDSARRCTCVPISAFGSSTSHSVFLCDAMQYFFPPEYDAFVAHVRKKEDGDSFHHCFLFFLLLSQQQK